MSCNSFQIEEDATFFLKTIDGIKLRKKLPPPSTGEYSLIMLMYSI